MAIKSTDLDQAIDLAFEEKPNEEVLKDFADIQKYIYLAVRIRRNELTIKHLNELREMKLDLIELRREIQKHLEGL